MQAGREDLHGAMVSISNCISLCVRRNIFAETGFSSVANAALPGKKLGSLLINADNYCPFGISFCERVWLGLSDIWNGYWVPWRKTGRLGKGLQRRLTSYKFSDLVESLLLARRFPPRAFFRSRRVRRCSIRAKRANMARRKAPSTANNTIIHVIMYLPSLGGCSLSSQYRLTMSLHITSW